MNLVGEDVEQDLGVGVCPQVTLIRQFALALQCRAQFLRICQIAVMNLQQKRSRKRQRQMYRRISFVPAHKRRRHTRYMPSGEFTKKGCASWAVLLPAVG